MRTPVLSRIARLPVLVLALLTLAAGCESATGRVQRASPAPSKTPNIILISVDCLNGREFRSIIEAGKAPNLARLAGDSLSFTNAHAHAPWTTPSHMSMLTGLYPSEHGRNVPYPFANPILVVQGHQYERKPKHPALAPWLHELGYETIGFVGLGSVSAKYGLGRGFDTYHETPKNDAMTDLPENLRQLTAWIEERRDRPFFLFLHTFDLHDPIPVHTGLAPDGSATIAYIDSQLGRLFAVLRAHGLYDRALIFFTGDHGSHMIRAEGKCCAHGAGHYEENLRVPLLVKLPGSSLTGERSAIARHIDILPTVADVLGAEVPGYRGEGVSLLRVASGEVQTKYSFSEADGRCVERYGLVDRRYKYIYTPRTPEQYQLIEDPRFHDGTCTQWCTNPAPEELYNLHADPFEQNDLLKGPDSAAYGTQLARFRRVMRRHLNLEPQYRRSVEPARTAAKPASPELQNALRSLGYLE